MLVSTIKIIVFPGGLTDTSAKTKTLVLTISDVDTAVGSSCEIVDKPTVYSANHCVPCSHRITNVFYVFHEPSNLESREVCADGQAGDVLEVERSMSFYHLVADVPALVNLFAKLNKMFLEYSHDIQITLSD